MEIAKGTYERISTENFDEFLTALDVNILVRKAATASSPCLEVTEENGLWTIKTSTPLSKAEFKFKIGEKFDEITPDGRAACSLMTVEGNKFVCVQTAKVDGEKSTKSVRQFTEEGCTVTIEILGSNVICSQQFKRL